MSLPPPRFSDLRIPSVMEAHDANSKLRSLAHDFLRYPATRQGLLDQTHEMQHYLNILTTFADHRNQAPFEDPDYDQRR